LTTARHSLQSSGASTYRLSATSAERRATLAAWVHFDEDNRLQRGKDVRGSRILDFSHAAAATSHSAKIGD
jgi:hypothetical protein